MVTWFEMGKQDDSKWWMLKHVFQTKSLVFVPKFSYVQINKHLKDCGKKEIGKKGYKYFVENYIYNVYVGRTSSAVSTIKSRCYQSQRKSEEPHTLQICVLSSNVEANVLNANCLCKAG